MGKRRRWAAGLLLLALPVLSQEARRESHAVEPPAGTAVDKQGGAEARYGVGETPAPGPTAGYGPAEFTRPADARSQQARREQGALAEATLIAIEGDAARLRLPEGERTLRAGDTLGEDVVKRVGGRQIVLRRPARPGHAGGDARIVADFDAAGRARVNVIWSGNPGTPVPPEVR